MNSILTLKLLLKPFVIQSKKLKRIGAAHLILCVKLFGKPLMMLSQKSLYHGGGERTTGGDNMPRVNLGRDPTKDRQEATRRIIRRGMAEQGITTQKELAERIGINEQILRKRMRGDTSWDLETMVKIVKRLRLTESDTAVILGAKK